MCLLFTVSTVTTPSPPSKFARRTSQLYPGGGFKGLYTLSCKQKHRDGNVNNRNDEPSGAVDRRNILLGLGGMYGATATSGNMASAAPVPFDNPFPCGKATEPNVVLDKDGKGNIECCPPYAKNGEKLEIVEFKPPEFSDLRTRKAAHKLDENYKKKFRLAIQRMKDLEADDPRNFMQQAQIHCAYCNGAYINHSVQGEHQKLSVHGNWLFLPWHRFYLYFWERILGDLIDDPTFSIPYWNWDSPDGMKIPEIYYNEGACDDRDPTTGNRLYKVNPLFNGNRNSENLKNVIDFAGDKPTDPKDLECKNHLIMQLAIRGTLGLPETFMGGKLVAGQNVEGRGSPGILERIHNTPHKWVGMADKPNWDMGTFSTAARDPIFYAHHGNVDRMWTIYKQQRGALEFDDKDWLDTTFLFCDEKRRIVKCRVDQCLDPASLGYQYSTENIEWLHASSLCLQSLDALPKTAPVDIFGSNPRRLDVEGTIRALVKREHTSRSRTEKRKKIEVLRINNITLADRTAQAQFTVYINTTEKGYTVADKPGLIAGTFTYIADTHGASEEPYVVPPMANPIGDLIEDLNADADEEVVITLVHVQGNITIGSIAIGLVQSSWGR